MLARSNIRSPTIFLYHFGMFREGARLILATLVHGIQYHGPGAGGFRQGRGALRNGKATRAAALPILLRWN